MCITEVMEVRTYYVITHAPQLIQKGFDDFPCNSSLPLFLMTRALCGVV